MSEMEKLVLDRLMDFATRDSTLRSQNETLKIRNSALANEIEHRHPDNGGSHEDMSALNEARAAALKARP